MKSFLYCLCIPLFILTLAGCGGGGGGDSEDSSDLTNNPGNPNANSNIDLYDQLESALSQRVVSTADPSGLWMLYAKGTNNSSFNFAGGSSDQNETINLFALVFSVFVVGTDPSLEIVLAACTGSYNANQVLAGAAISTVEAGEFKLTLQQIRRMASAFYPFTPADALLDSDYQAFLDREISASLIDNSLMTFPNSFSFTDSTGSSTGTATFEIRARKFADDTNTDLGQLVVSDQTRGSHCFTHSNILIANESNTLIAGQNSNVLNQWNHELFSIISWPSSVDGITSLLYQRTGEQVSTIDNQVSPNVVPPTNAVDLNNTAGQFTRISATDAVETHLVSITPVFNIGSGFSMDFSVSNGATTLVGNTNINY